MKEFQSVFFAELLHCIFARINEMLGAERLKWHELTPEMKQEYRSMVMDEFCLPNDDVNAAIVHGIRDFVNAYEPKEKDK